MLPASHRLRSNQEFQQVYRRGRSWAHPLLILHVLEQPHGKKLGISVSKKVGKAHVRNLVRRRVREIARARLPVWCEGFASVVVARPAAANAPFAELEAALLELARRARLSREPNSTEVSLYRLPVRSATGSTPRGKAISELSAETNRKPEVESS